MPSRDEESSSAATIPAPATIPPAADGDGEAVPGDPLRDRVNLAVILLSLGGVWMAILLGWQVGLLGVEHEDLEVYRFGVQAWRNGQDFYGHLPTTSAGAHLPFLYPPFAVLALSPLGLLPWTPAVLALFALNIASVVATMYVVLRAVRPSLTTMSALAIASLVVPPILLLEPLRETFRYGQLNLVLMGLVAVDCLARRTVWPRGTGIGLAAAIKLTPAAFILFFLVRKDYRSAGAAVGTAMAATGIGFLIGGDASFRFWFGGFEMMRWMSGTPYFTNQTIEASLARYDLGEPAQTIAWVVLVVLLLATVVYAMRRSDPAMALLLNAALALLVSPTSWSHHWVWVAPAIVLMAAHAAARWRDGSPMALAWLWLMAVTAALFYLSPLHFVPGARDRELQWTVAQQFLGNSYTWFTIVLIIGYAIACRLRDLGRFPGDARSTTSTMSSPSSTE